MNYNQMVSDSKNISWRNKKSPLDLLFLAVVAIIIYLPFLGQPAWDGNEPKRAIVAREMLKTGNYFAPVIHGQPYYVKPPLMNWFIAAGGGLFGEVNEWTARLSSVLLTFATSILLYFLTGRWLDRESRFFAALAFLTMIGIMGKGRTAEIDSLFICLVTLNLLVWLHGYTRPWKDSLLWTVSLALLAVSFLSKGPQAIAIFYSTVFAYLLVKKRLNVFFSLSHLSGIIVLAVLLGLYMLTVLRHVRFDEYLFMWRDQILQRSVSKHSFSFIEHFVLYPLRIIPQFMPWVLFAAPLFFLKDLRKKMPALFKNELFVFSLVMLAANIPLYWLLPNTRVRYVLPVGPFIAIATAFLFNLYLKQTANNLQFFRRAMKYIAMATLLVAFMAVPTVLLLHMQFTPALIVLLAGLAILSSAVILTIYSSDLQHALLYLAFMTGLIFLVYTELDIRHDMEKVHYPRKVSREIMAVLPGDADPVYEIGFDRFLRVTSYLDREVIQLDRFSQLKKADNGRNVYFIFDADFLNNITPEQDRKIMLQDIAWEKVYSGRFEPGRNEIVVGYLK
ncbi:MAG: glycosyltransferase family 39 protein [Nitrospirae bacterium]|nr:glycosyltransferase family 39 protein [Nitrospirota bacterium]